MSKGIVSMRQLFGYVALVGCVLLFALPALADEKARASASAHFERGARLYEEGNLDGARVEFERAYALKPDYRLLYNIAQVQLERHEYVAAKDLFQRYLSEGGDAIGDERRARVEAEIAGISDRIADVSIKVNVAGATIYVNDQEIGTSPLAGPIKVNAGTRKIRVSKSGFVSQSQSVEVAGRDRAHIVVDLVPEASGVGGQGSSAQPDAVPRSGQERASRAEAGEANYTPFWWSAGAAVVLGGVAGTFGYLAYDADRSLDAEFGRLPADRNRIETLSDRVRAYSLVSDGATVGAVIATVIAVYFLSDPPKRSVEADHAFIRVAPVPSGAGVEVAF